MFSRDVMPTMPIQYAGFEMASRSVYLRRAKRANEKGVREWRGRLLG
jgi:hypothetical protein